MRDLWRPLLLLTLVLLLPVLPFLLFGEALESWIKGIIAESFSAWLVILILSSDILLPIPSSVISTMGGVKLGPLVGSLASMVGMTVGASLGYWLARWFGRPLVRRLSRETDLERAEKINHRFGPGMILITRGVPVLAEASVLLTGMHGLAWRRFLLPMLVSNLVLSTGYSLIGYYAGEMEWLWLALTASIAIPVILALVVQQIQQRNKSDTP
jgi:membrane protein DedA with SNARE-associated domain